jgi:Domain of unknown function (DUF6265)
MPTRSIPRLCAAEPALAGCKQTGMGKTAMKAFAFAFLSLLTLAVNAAEPSATKPTLDAFAWLAGHWRLEVGEREVDEQWMSPAGGLMMGMARAVEGGKVAEYEFTLLRQEPNGDIFYVANPSKQREAKFRLTSLMNGEAVFENPDHDFPQKIIYAQRADGSLLAVIEGPGKDGKTRRVEYPFRRIAKEQ